MSADVNWKPLELASGPRPVDVGVILPGLGALLSIVPVDPDRRKVADIGLDPSSPRTPDRDPERIPLLDIGLLLSEPLLDPLLNPGSFGVPSGSSTGGPISITRKQYSSSSLA